MAEYQELLDAIAAVRRKAGDDGAWMKGLSTSDLAVATNPMLSSADRITLLINKIRGVHPEVFGGAAPTGSGSAASAITAAEAALAHQRSHTAQLDLQVITAILNAHSTNEDSQRELANIQQEIEGAVTSRTDLDTPAGARDFQRYLLGKLRDIRAIVDGTGVDVTSKATLSAALASLYVASGQPDSTSMQGPEPFADVWLNDDLLDLGPLPMAVEQPPAAPYPTSSPFNDIPPAAVPPGTASPMLAPPMNPALPSFGGSGLPSSGMPGAGASSLPQLDSLLPGARLEPRQFDEKIESDDRPQTQLEDPDRSETEPTEDDEPPTADERAHDADPATAVLPNGETVTADNPELAKVITAAAHGLPIDEALLQQGFVVPAPGSPVVQPIEVGQVHPGDIGVFMDRHALALNDGKALLNNQIEPITELPTLGFLGWQRPVRADVQLPKSDIPTSAELTTAVPSG